MWIRLAPARTPVTRSLGRNALARVGRDALARLVKDWQWWLALAAGPLFWALLWVFGHGVGDTHWPLAQPGTYLRLAVAMPVLEELVFRGWLQGWMLEQRWGTRRTAGLSSANVLTSALFCAAHFFYHAPLWAASVFIPSLVFGYFRERHGSVLPAILLHVAYNAGYFWLFFKFAA
jgi:uncharacterized protein